MRGEYGRLPAPVNEEVRRKVIGDAKVITLSPPPTTSRRNWRSTARRSASISPRKRTCSPTPCSRRLATKFFEYRQAQQLKLDNSLLDKENHVMPV